MANITTRAGKGASLSWNEADANFINLNTDKLEASALTPYLTTTTAASTYETQAHATNTYETQSHASSTYLTKANNLSDLSNTSIARTNLGLGTAATQASTSFATSGAVTTNGNTMNTGKLLGRTTSGSGAIEEISLGSGLSMTSGVISAAGGVSITSLETANTLDTASIHTIAHGKGSIPVILCFRLVVTTSTAGWSVGDVIDKWIAISGTTEEHVSIGADSTNIIVARGVTTIGIANKSTGANTSVSLSNFKLRVYIVS